MPTREEELKNKIIVDNIYIGVCILICILCILAATDVFGSAGTAGIGFAIFGVVLSFGCAVFIYLTSKGNRKELADSIKQTELYRKKREEDLKKASKTPQN